MVMFAIITTVSCENNNSENNLSDYNFRSINGDRVDLSKYRGKYSLLSFSFTRCPSICPMINKELVKLKNQFQDDINIVSINVDPDNDSPESLKKYMKDNGFDWDVLVGDIKEVDKVVNVMLARPDKKISSPSDHLPNLYLMNKNFEYIDKFFPEPIDVGYLIDKLNSIDL